MSAMENPKPKIRCTRVESVYTSRLKVIFHRISIWILKNTWYFEIPINIYSNIISCDVVSVLMYTTTVICSAVMSVDSDATIITITAMFINDYNTDTVT